MARLIIFVWRYCHLRKIRATLKNPKSTPEKSALWPYGWSNLHFWKETPTMDSDSSLNAIETSAMSQFYSNLSTADNRHLDDASVNDETNQPKQHACDICGQTFSTWAVRVCDDFYIFAVIRMLSATAAAIRARCLFHVLCVRSVRRVMYEFLDYIFYLNSFLQERLKTHVYRHDTADLTCRMCRTRFGDHTAMYAHTRHSECRQQLDTGSSSLAVVYNTPKRHTPVVQSRFLIF
jgi:hypothetical protein